MCILFSIVGYIPCKYNSCRSFFYNRIYPYIKLYPGTYTVEIKGRNLDKAELECGVEAEESESGSKDVFFVMDELSVTPTSATYSFTIDRTYKNVETRVLNNTDDIVSIESIYIKRTKVTK